MLHGKVLNIVLPSGLILAAVLLLTYCHATATLGGKTMAPNDVLLWRPCDGFAILPGLGIYSQLFVSAGLVT